MNNTLNDLGLEYFENTSDYNALYTRLYDYYGMAEILEPQTDFDFPEPIIFASFVTDRHPEYSGHPGLDPGPPVNREHFFKHLLHHETRTLLPFVEATLANEHANSPIIAAAANLEIDRESLAQIVDRAYRLAASADATANPSTRALLNMLVLTELLMWRN